MSRKWLKRAGSASIILGAANAGAAAIDVPLSTNSAYNSGNWSGYDAIAPSGSAFTSISSTWVVPTLTVKPSTGSDYLGSWIGFDGYTKSDGTVEQCGIEASISSIGTTSYYAWYEFFPAGTHEKFLVNPGDTINASITYAGQSGSTYTYDITIKDTTTGSSFSKGVTTANDDLRQSAEWITEAPSIGNTIQTPPNYGSITFSGDTAALNGDASQNLSTLNYNSIRMTQSGVFLSTPSLISNSGSAFTTDYGSFISAAWSDGGGDHSWANFNNWNPATVLTAAGAVANFNSTGAGLVTLDGNETVGKININSATAYTILQGTGGSLVINDSSDPALDPSINVMNGSHTISAPVIMSSGASINFQNNSGLTVSNTISGSGTLTVSGAGTLTVATSGVLPQSSPLVINSGAKVALAANANPAAPVVQTVASLSFDSTVGSILDITNNEMIVTGTGPATIRNDIIAGNIVSSLGGSQFGVGYIADGFGTEIRYTLLGDTNLDGTVNFTDLLTLATDYGMTGADWAQGDFYYNGSVNFTDLLALATNYGVSLTPSNDAEFSPAFAADWNLALSEVASSVPEPTSLAMLAIGATGLLARRRAPV